MYVLVMQEGWDKDRSRAENMASPQVDQEFTRVAQELSKARRSLSLRLFSQPQCSRVEVSIENKTGLQCSMAVCPKRDFETLIAGVCLLSVKVDKPRGRIVIKKSKGYFEKQREFESGLED